MKVLSLFSGAGGFDLGMLQAGHRVVWANDNDPDACETYRNEIGHRIVCGDIEDIDASKIPDGHVVIGGFPCQGFSQANLLRHAKDGRNKLYVHFLRIVEEKRPFYFLAENVRGLLSLDNGRAIKRIVEDFHSANYRVQYRVFNVANYGVPQSRWRVIIAGTRDDLPTTADFDFPVATHCNPLRGQNRGLLSAGPVNNLKPWVTIAEALDGIPEPTERHSLPNHICSQYKVTNRNFTGHRTTDPNKPSPTILARGNGKGGVCAIQHPCNHRRMSIRESAVIQTFPRNFTFAGAMNSCYRQVGNAVPVLFAKRLGESLKTKEWVTKL